MRRLPLHPDEGKDRPDERKNRPEERKDRNVAAVWPSTEQVIRSRPLRPRKVGKAGADDGEREEQAALGGDEGSRKR